MAIILNAQGKYAQAQRLYEKALEIRRRLLTDDHPRTALCYNNFGVQSSTPRGSTPRPSRYTRRRWRSAAACSPTTTPTPLSYNNVAYNLNAQGKHAQAQPLFEKALEIRRRLLTDDHPETALSYNNLAFNLNAQGKYAQAQPLFEKALEIRPPPAHRRPPRHRPRLRQCGGQP